MSKTEISCLKTKIHIAVEKKTISSIENNEVQLVARTLTHDPGKRSERIRTPEEMMLQPATFS